MSIFLMLMWLYVGLLVCDELLSCSFLFVACLGI
jgi:hypothetical protein